MLLSHAKEYIKTEQRLSSLLEKTGCAAKGQEGWLQVIVQLISHCVFRGKDDGGGYLSVSLHGFVKHPWRGFLVTQ